MIITVHNKNSNDKIAFTDDKLLAQYLLLNTNVSLSFEYNLLDFCQELRDVYHCFPLYVEHRTAIAS